MAEAFNVEKYPDFYNGKATRCEIVMGFLKQFPDPQGTITFDQFVDYYTDLSVGITSDEYFSDLIRNTWGVCLGGKKEVTKQEIQFILKTLREKLIQKTNGAHDELLLR